jgi:hypothetical protein
MTSNKNILLENFLLKFAYKFEDKFGNDLYIFEVAHDAELSKIKKEIKKMKKENLTVGWTYEKDDHLYIKVKKKHINRFNKFKFEKDKVYRANLNLVYYDYKEHHGFYTTMLDTEQMKDEFDSD